MESLGYYSNDTQIKTTIDSKNVKRLIDIEGKIKEAYSLIVGPK